MLGGGALGSLFGGLLAGANDVIVLGRKPAVETIARRGLRLEGATRKNAAVKVATDAGALDPPDLLLVAVKAYDTEVAISEAIGLIGSRTAVLSMQNGITTIDLLAKLVPEPNLIAGWTSHGATLERPGVVRHAGAGDTVVGELDGRSTHRIRAISRAFCESDIATSVSAEIRRELWLKGLVNSAINPLTALARCENGRIATDKNLSRVAKVICAEGAAVARAEGHPITADAAYRRVIRVARQTSANRSSMLRDIEMGRRSEIDYLNGAIAALARERGLPAPVNEALSQIVRGIEGENRSAGGVRGK